MFIVPGNSADILFLLAALLNKSGKEYIIYVDYIFV